MEQTPATRFVDVLGRLGYKTQQQIADLLDIARPTAGTIVRYEKPPSFESVATLKEKHPEINMEWIFTGNGTAFVTGEAAPAATMAHARATGEARTTAHPTIQPTDKELATGTATGPYLHDEDPVVQQLMIRLAEKDRIIERQQEDIEAWRDAFRKPLASAEAATTAMSIRRWQGAYAATATEAAPECRVLPFKIAA